MFVLGLCLILSVRKSHARVMARADGETGLKTIQTINRGTVQEACMHISFVVMFSLVILCIWCSGVIWGIELLVLTFYYLGTRSPL
jgi:hypothetical protein